MDYPIQQEMIGRAHLYEKLADTEAADSHQSKRVADLMRIFSIKKKADADYRTALQLVNQEINRYLQSQQLFLCELVKSYQSFLAISHQHKQTLLEGYDQEVLGFLSELKQAKISENISKKVRFAEESLARHVDLLKQVKGKLKQLDDEMTVLKTEVKFKERVSALTEAENREYSQKLKNLVLARGSHQAKLMDQLKQLSDVCQVYFQTHRDIVDYQQQYLNDKSNDIVDTVMRVFVLEVAYIRSVEHDVGGILKRLKDNRDQSKRTTEVDLMLKQSPKQNLTGRLWDAYRTFTSTPFTLDESYVPEQARKRWMEICAGLSSLER